VSPTCLLMKERSLGRIEEKKVLASRVPASGPPWRFRKGMPLNCGAHAMLLALLASHAAHAQQQCVPADKPNPSPEAEMSTLRGSTGRPNAKKLENMDCAKIMRCERNMLVGVSVDPIGLHDVSFCEPFVRNFWMDGWTNKMNEVIGSPKAGKNLATHKISCVLYPSSCQ